MNKAKFRKARAFTVTEAVLSMLVLSTLVIGVLSSVETVATARRLRAEHRIADGLAHHLLSEATRHPLGAKSAIAAVVTPVEDVQFTPLGNMDPVPIPQARVDFKTVWEHHGWTGSPPQLITGDDIPGLENWSRSITITPVEDDLDIEDEDTGIVLVTVTVTAPSGAQLTRSTIRTGNDDPPDHVASTWLGIDISIEGRTPVRKIHGTSLINRPAPNSAP